MFELRNSGENRMKRSEFFFENLPREYKDLILVKKKFKIISCLCTFNDYRKHKDGRANFLVIPLIANPQILVLTPQSQIRTFLRLASPKSKICKLVMIKLQIANFLGVPVRKLQIRKFARKTAVFLIEIRIGLLIVYFLPK